MYEEYIDWNSGMTKFEDNKSSNLWIKIHKLIDELNKRSNLDFIIDDDDKVIERGNSKGVSLYKEDIAYINYLLKVEQSIL